MDIFNINLILKLIKYKIFSKLHTKSRYKISN